MDCETWLDKATRLQRSLTREDRPHDPQDHAAASSERIKIALWLRQEFSDEPPAEIHALTDETS